MYKISMQILFVKIIDATLYTHMQQWIVDAE